MKLFEIFGILTIVNGIIGIVICMMNAINHVPFSIKRVPIFIWNMIVLAIVTIIFYLYKI